MTDTAPDADPSARPVIRLKPKAGRRFLAGAPWVYQDELVLDRRTRAIARGTIAELQDSDRRPLGAVAVNLDSVISARLLDRDPEALIDRAWLLARLEAAARLRADLFESPHHRLVNAEADRLPGVVIDRYGDAAVIQPNAAWAEALIDPLADALQEVTGVATIILNGASRARALEGLPSETRLLRGPAPEGPVEAPMNGALYLADLMEGQKTGLYFDQRPNHAFVARLAEGREVLDVFSHVGGFALAALARGAASVLCVDGSEPALALSTEAAARMGVASRHQTAREDAFDALARLAAEGRRFGVVICDPPAFAPARSALQNGLRAYHRVARLAARVTEPGGYLTLCSCSAAADLDAFRGSCAAGLRAAGREAQLIRSGGPGPDHPVHPALPETSYLKALTFRLF